MRCSAKNQRAVALRASLAAIVIAYSLAASATSQVAVDRTITQLGSYNNLAYIVFTPAMPNLEGCSYTTGDQVAIDWSTNPDAKAMYATALAAYLSGQKVGFGVTGCHSGGLPLAYRIDVKP